MGITVNSTESKRYFLSTDEDGVNSWTSSVSFRIDITYSDLYNNYIYF